MSGDIDNVTQRVVSANGAPAVSTTGVNSPFAMGQRFLEESQAGAGAGDQAGAGTPDPQERGPAAGGTRVWLRPRAIKILEAQGAMTDQELAAALDADLVTVRRMVASGVRAGLIVRTTDKERGELVGPGGVQQKKAKAAAVPATVPPTPKAASAARKVKPVRQPRAKAPVAAPAPALPVVASAPVPEFACGLFSTGELQLDLPAGVLVVERPDGRKEVRLQKAWVRDLVTYLDRVDNGSLETRS